MAAPSLSTHVAPEASAAPSAPLIDVRDLSLYYGAAAALRNVTMEVREGAITAFIGPSGCGKSTLLRCFNRMNDAIEQVRIEGVIAIGGQNIYHPDVDVARLRRRVGMVFQRPNPFPRSIFENIGYGLRLRGIRKRADLEIAVERSLRQAALWEEVKDRLHQHAFELAGGQQQRLCIARALAVEPSVLLMDEPASALDPTATTRIEELIVELRRRYTIVIVTHNMQQAARLSDHTAFFCSGELVEYDSTARIFTNPRRRQTEDYVTGRFG